MLRSILTAHIFFSVFILFGQEIRPLEKNIPNDFIYEADLKNNKFYYYNNNHTINIGIINISDTTKISGNIKVYDFNTVEVTNNLIYSKTDSINEILAILTDNFNYLYTIRALRQSENDTLPIWYLEKRKENLSEVLESTILPFNTNFINIVNAFFDENNDLYIKGYQFFPTGKTFYYILDNTTSIIDSFSHNGVNYNYFHKANDTTLIDIFDYNTRRINYIKRDSFNISNQIIYGNSYSTTMDKSVLFKNELFFGGREVYGFFQAPDFDAHAIFRHKLYSDTVEALLIDTFNFEGTVRSFNGLDLMDTNYIYSGINLQPCFFNKFDYTCESSFKLYCVSSQGQVHWTKIIGGDANNYLWHIIATPDTGCLALFYRYAEQDSALNGDFYWLKYDKFGNQDTTFFSGFNEWTSVSGLPTDFSEIIVYPNPTTDFLYFDYSSSIKDPIIYIYDVSGKLMLSERISDKKIDISSYSNGHYLYRIVEKDRLLKTGKLIKQ